MIPAIALSAAAGAYAATNDPVTKVSEAWAADWGAGKLDAVMALYGPDPIFDTAGGAPWEGKEEIRKHFAEVLTQLKADLKLTSRRSQSAGNLAYDSGTYVERLTSLKDGKVLHTQGSYLFLFVRVPDAGWKILEQTWTGSEPKL